MSDRFDTIADAVDALTNPMHVREKIEYWDHNRNKKIHWWDRRMRSLLEQLATAAIPGEVYVEDSGGHIRRTPNSTPPARIEAISLDLAITAWAADTVWKAKLTVREDTAANLRALVGAKLDSETADEILVQLRRWVPQALVIAGWQRPPYRPPAPCPVCDQPGLRVRLDAKTAVCVECRETWDEATIGLLAEHVRSVTNRTLDTATA